MGNASKGKRLVLTFATTGLATIVSFCINFFLTPYVTAQLGVEAYGFISLANTFVSYAMIVMTAFNSFATRFIAVSYHEGDIPKASGYMSSLVVANLAITALIFLAMLPFIFCIDGILDVPERLVQDVKYLFCLTFFNFIVTNASSSFSSAAYIKNRLDVYGIFQVAAHLASAAVILFCYTAFNPCVWFYGLGIIASSLICFSGNLYLYRKYAPEITVSPRLFSFADLKDILSLGVWNSINQLGNVLNNGLGLLIANLLLSAASMGQLAIAKTFTLLFSRLYQLVSQAFYPLILESYSKEETENLLRYLTLASKASGFFACLVFAGFFGLGLYFYQLWIPEQDTDVIYALTILVMLATVVEGPVYPLYYIYGLVKKNKVPTFITLAGGVLNIAAMVPLVMFTGLGIYAIPLVTAIVCATIALVTNPLYMARCLNLKPTYFYPVLIRVFGSCAVSCILFRIVGAVISPASWLMFVVSVVVCCAVQFVVYAFVGLDSAERSYFLAKAKSLLKAD